MKNISIKDSTITVNVSDLNQSIAFYESIGLQMHTRWENHYAEMTTAGIKIGLHPVDNPSEIKSSESISIGYFIEDFDKAKDALTERGISFTERHEEGGNFIHFNDPDGTALYFIDPKW